MMAKPAATKIRLGNKHHGRPPRPDPPLLRHLPPPPPPETRRRRSLRPRRRRQLSDEAAFELDREEEEEEEERGLKKLRLVVKLPRSPAARPNRAAAVPTTSSSSSSPSPSPAPSSSSSYVDEDELGENGDDDVETVKPPKKRRIDRCSESPVVAVCRSGYREEIKKNAPRRSSGVGSGNLPSPWSGTLMPEKMELELILQKLQKKDTYNAFAEPVDPEELPDYHDVIEHPMDFGTVRKKLDRGAYRSFEQFEDDVLLICSNAMQYNAPDTVYFRQACAIQELARKKFQIVRENLKHAETEKSHQRSKGKFNNLTPMVKKIPRTLCTPKIQCKAVVEPIVSDLSSGATLASAGDTSTGLSTVNGIEKSVAVNELLDASSSLEGGKQDKSSAVNGFLDASSSLEESKQEKSVAVNGVLDANSSLGVSKQEKPVGINGVLDASSSLRESKQEKSVAVNELLDGASSPGESKQDKGDDFLAKCSPSKLGRKATLVDENRRATYNTTPQQKPMVESNFVLNLFEDQEKQLIPVGLDFDHSYARSLARFTALLGPVAWEIASKKIENALPPGMKFGPGWVGEYEPLPTPFLSVENSTSFSKTARNDKFAEMKSKDERQNPSSSNKELLAKKQLASKAPRKASNSVNSTSCANLVEQKPRFIGVDSPAKSKINGTVVQKQCTDSRRIKLGVNNQINNRILSVTSVRVKEETHEIEERRQEAIHANDLAQTQATTQRNSHQQQNEATVEFPKPLPNALPQAHQGEPLNKTGLTSFPVIFSRESSHMQTETQKVFQAVSSQNLNTAPEISTRGSNTAARLNNSLAFISANQTGVNYSLGRLNNNNNNNQDHASNYPFKLESFPGKVGNQQNFSNSSTTHVDQSMPIVSPRSKENFSPATSAAAKAWMSVRASGHWKSVESKNSSEKPSIISSPFYSPPTWKPPTSAPQFNGYSMVRPANIPLQVEASQFKNRGLVIFPQLIPTDLSKYQNYPSWQVSSPQPQSKQRDNLPPDLNIGYQAPGSPIQPSSSLAMDSQQPDLALQL